MGRMKTQSERMMKKMARDAARREYLVEQQKRATAVIDLDQLKNHVRELIDMSERDAVFDREKFYTWREKAMELVDYGKGQVAVQDDTQITTGSGAEM